MLMKTGILYFTTCFHGFGILRHVDPFVRMLHIICIDDRVVCATTFQWCSGKFSLVGTLAGHYGHIPYRYRGGGGYKSMFKHWGGGEFFRKQEVL